MTVALLQCNDDVDDCCDRVRKCVQQNRQFGFLVFPEVECSQGVLNCKYNP